MLKCISIGFEKTITVKKYLKENESHDWWRNEKKSGKKY